jgi:hypothetical protein
MDIRLNIYDENNRWVGVDYLTEKGKWMHKWVHKGELERGSWRGRAVGENDINWRYESALDKPSEREQTNDNIPLVNNRTFIVTIECGEDTTDWKITAPNELAAKITASANYNRKRFDILRCVEYGC